MSWYKTGTVTVTNGSATVTGAGTLFVGAIAAGDAFVGPNGQVYEVVAVISATQLNISPSYQGGTQVGASYGVFPTYAALISFNTRLNALLVDYESVLTGAGAGKFLNGTAAAPGVSFVGDPDTGIRSVSANTFALVTGGVDRVTVSSSELKVDVPVTGSAVQSSGSDATIGRLLKVGAFGSGEQFTPPVVADLNSLTIPTGTYAVRMFSGTVGTFPDEWPNGFGMLECMRESPDHIHQRIVRRLSGGTRTVWRREYHLASGWTRWFVCYDANNIVGTVSQVGGVPTGSVVESGANANGSFTRWADGTQICTNGNNPIVTNPATFVGTVTSVDGSKMRIGRWF